LKFELAPDDFQHFKAPPMDTHTDLLEPFSKVAPRQLDWLWPGRLARGKLSIFDGDPELGKSLVTLDLCARLTTGRPLPDGSPTAPPGNVIVLNGEDGAADTVAPRLQALCADMTRVFTCGQKYLDESGPLRLPTDIGRLDRALTDTDAVLVVLDPIMAFLDSSINAASDMSVRRALAPLARLANGHGCHIIMVRHLNKGRHFRSLYRGGGSIGLLASCRSAFLFARDCEDTSRCVMAQIKNNLGPRQPSLAYRIDSHEAGLPRLEWLGPSPLSADQLLAGAEIKPSQPSPCLRAIDFLLAFLESGPRSTLDIWEAAKEIGIARRTLQRVRPKIDVRTRTVWSQNRALTFWLLPGQQVSKQVDPANVDMRNSTFEVADDVPSLEPWLAPIREQYPHDPLEEDL
jgi:hypothetical protein